MLRLFKCIVQEIFLIYDSLGVVRGSRWQKIRAWINFVAFYLVGVPLSAVLGFVVHLKGKGLWIGIVVGPFMQLTLLFLIAYFTNWNN